MQTQLSMINNYLSNLRNYLPDDLKQEVSAELEASILEQIEDQQEQLGRPLNQSEQEQLLRAIGHPMRVAAAYLPNQQLIGKEYFPAYKKTLELALTIVFALIILFSVPSIFSDERILAGVASLLGNLADTGLTIFAIVTLVFYLMQKSGVSLDEIYAWSPKSLSNKADKLSLSRVEVGFEILFYLLFLAWWHDAIGLPESLQANDRLSVLALSAEWQQVALAINLIIGFSIAINIYKFAIAGWTRFSLVADIILCFAALGVLYTISQFDQYLAINIELEQNPDRDRIFKNVSNTIGYILGFIAVVNIWDIYSNVRKFLRL